MKIEVKVRKADSSEINIKAKRQDSMDTLFYYWNGSDSEYSAYKANYGMNSGIIAGNLEQIHELNNSHIKSLLNAFKSQNIGKFDFRLASVIIPKNLKELNSNDYMKLTLDLSTYSDESIKQHIKDIFLSVDSRSLLDFRSINNDICEMFYYKKGIYDSSDKISILSAKDRVTLADNFQEPRDSNFICSGLLLEMSKEMIALGLGDELFSHTYNLTNGATKELNRSANELASFEHLNNEEKANIIKQEALKREATKEAKEEIAKENAAFRQSLKNDSNDNEILNAKPQITLSVREMQESKNVESRNIKETKNNLKKEILNSDEIDNIIKSSFEFYKQKEREKTELRLQKAQEKAKEAYYDLKENLNDGQSILDAINFIRQKYRNDDTINLASLMFAQDILSLKSLENTIHALNENLEDKDKDLDRALAEVEKRDSTISELRGTITKKSNEFNLLKESFESERVALKQEIEIKLNNLSTEYEQKLDEANSIIDETQDTLESAINQQKELKNQIIELTNTKNILEEKNKNLAILLDNEKEKLKNEVEKSQMQFSLLKERSDLEREKDSMRIKMLEEKLEILQNQLNTQTQINTQSTKTTPKLDKLIEDGKKIPNVKDVLGEIPNDTNVNKKSK